MPEPSTASSSTPPGCFGRRAPSGGYSVHAVEVVNGTVLHYCFFGDDSHFAVPKIQADAVRGAFVKWKTVGIGLEFQEVNQLSEAEIRIGYSTVDGSSASAVGRDVLTVP